MVQYVRESARIWHITNLSTAQTKTSQPGTQPRPGRAADTAQDDVRPVHWADEEADPHDLARHHDQGDEHHAPGGAGHDDAQDYEDQDHGPDDGADHLNLDWQQVKY